MQDFESRFSGVFDRVVALVKEFEAETDRGAVLVGAAFLEHQLGELLTRYFVDDAKIVAELLNPGGPAGTFSSRIKLAYCIGLLRPDQFRDLETVRKLRNEFAHTFDKASFRHARARDLCANLQQISLMELQRGKMSEKEQKILIDAYKTAREKFIGNVIHLIIGLAVRADRIAHQPVGGTGGAD